MKNKKHADFGTYPIRPVSAIFGQHTPLEAREKLPYLKSEFTQLTKNARRDKRLSQISFTHASANLKWAEECWREQNPGPSINLTDTARLLNIAREDVRDLINAGYLSARKTTQQVLVTTASIATFLETFHRMDLTALKWRLMLETELLDD
jgi:hypothetical protein